MDLAKSDALKKMVKAAKRARLGKRVGEEHEVPGLTIILGMGRPEPHEEVEEVEEDEEVEVEVEEEDEDEDEE